MENDNITYYLLVNIFCRYIGTQLGSHRNEFNITLVAFIFDCWLVRFKSSKLGATNILLIDTLSSITMSQVLYHH